MPASTQALTYEMCAVDGGAQLVNNTLVELGKSQFTYKTASCNYPSEEPLSLFLHNCLLYSLHRAARE